ncbi:hypothetical protein GONAM_11_01280 [Gordonia namibiensis NBRC 108229]|uniref:Uncharacterized protein n=1 Tax=Gordonia namibiensis NBRC 108229 TaxID=1208314 RepID=K6VUN9_9ACTN|nr:hypothetical protein GONAM_11_01280 [Gordonia namibiensis NBRC 108229]
MVGIPTVAIPGVGGPAAGVAAWAGTVTANDAAIAHPNIATAGRRTRKPWKRVRRSSVEVLDLLMDYLISEW